MAAATALKHPPIAIERPDPSAPILVALARETVAIRAGTVIRVGDRAHAFEADTPVSIETLLEFGVDCGIAIDDDGRLSAVPVAGNPLDGGFVAGFHFAPGGNAAARSGGDAIPAVNPCSLWDIGFRPSCPDPRGMALVEAGAVRFWADIYLLGVDHRQHGTSRCGAVIADGDTPPGRHAGKGRHDRFDHATAAAIYAHHGKRLLTYDEFRAAAFGVTEKSSAERDPETTGLDAARTSRAGLMQATGNMWQWGTDGDPDDPRPSIFGGSWVDGSDAGSRYALLVYWPGDSGGCLSARGGSDHLNPV